MSTAHRLHRRPTYASAGLLLTGHRRPDRPGSAERLAHVFKALGDPTRVRLLSLIAAAEDGEACVCDLIEPVGLSQPTVSHHMKLLVDAGLVTREQRGKWAYYRVINETLIAMRQALQPDDDGDRIER